MVRSQTYIGHPSVNYIMDNQLRYVTILMVAREGRIYKLGDSAPAAGTNTFYYDMDLGTIEFSNEDRFNATIIDGVTVYEKIFVEWEEF
jgi:hypothetical protein